MSANHRAKLAGVVEQLRRENDPEKLHRRLAQLACRRMAAGYQDDSAARRKLDREIERVRALLPPPTPAERAATKRLAAQAYRRIADVLVPTTPEEVACVAKARATADAMEREADALEENC